MKVGTDAVLLGAWAELNAAMRILDIGTGSGVIALIAAQRTTSECLIDGIEIQYADSVQAAANVAASPWADRIRIVQTPVQDFHPSHRYDVILCNPPFFIDSLLPPAEGRVTARHAVTLNHQTLASTSNRLLSPTGSVSMIMPPDEGNKFVQEMKKTGFYASRMTSFRTRPGKKIERVLISFRRVGIDGTRSTNHSELELYSSEDQWSPAYRQLTASLYLAKGNY